MRFLLAARTADPSQGVSPKTHFNPVFAYKSLIFNTVLPARCMHSRIPVIGEDQAMSEKQGNEREEREFTKTVSLNSAYVAISCAALLYAVSWVMGCSTAPTSKTGGGKKINHSAELVHLSEEDKVGPAISGRKLTVEKMAQRAATSLQYSNEE